ncbi:MAG: ABC transporter ATP-binding protein [Vicinamibacteria bacterium]|nr:ABC transporter ATP-binding protein [Vicinamibacteria bacterium]
MSGLLRARGLAYTYGGPRPTEALSAVDLDLAAGEYVAVVGPSGCGKTTLLKLVARLLVPGTGELAWRPGPPPRQALVFQEDGLFPWLSLKKNVAFALEAHGRPAGEATARAAEALDRLGLAELAGRYPHELSPGMRQRVALARALVVEPELLLLDEPFASLDAQSRWALQAELASTCGAGAYAVLHVTHDLEEALLLADRVLVMSSRPGRVAEEIEVPLPRSRGTLRDRDDARLVALKHRLWAGLESEVRDLLALRRRA